MRYLLIVDSIVQGVTNAETVYPISGNTAATLKPFHFPSGVERWELAGAGEEEIFLEGYALKQRADDAGVVETERERLLLEMNQEWSVFVVGRYDLGTQSTFHALYNDPSGAAGRELTQEEEDQLKGSIKSVFDWVREGLIYYYQHKQALQQAADLTELYAVSWDFSSLIATDPGVTLEDIFVSLIGI